ncbi:MAG: hypothetical protein O3C25_03660 [Chloroflexi bacterium]|nr:hypothetical protein [Chloroflexota bacterium]
MVARRVALLAGLLAATIALATLGGRASAPSLSPAPEVVGERAAPPPSLPGFPQPFDLPGSFAPGFGGLPWVLDPETTPELWDRYCSPSAEVMRRLGSRVTASCNLPLG